MATNKKPITCLSLLLLLLFVLLVSANLVECVNPSPTSGRQNQTRNYRKLQSVPTNNDVHDDSHNNNNEQNDMNECAGDSSSNSIIDISGSSLAFEKCITIQGEGTTSTVSSVVVFDICLSGDCEHCEKRYVDIGVYSATLREYHETRINEFCSECFNCCVADDGIHCAEPIFEADRCHLMQSLQISNYSPSCEACVEDCDKWQNRFEYGYRDAFEFTPCTQIELSPSLSSMERPLFAGPICSSQGTKIKIGAFLDSDCTILDSFRNVDDYLVNENGNEMKISYFLFKRSFESIMSCREDIYCSLILDKSFSCNDGQNACADDTSNTDDANNGPPANNENNNGNGGGGGGGSNGVPSAPDETENEIENENAEPQQSQGGNKNIVGYSATFQKCEIVQSDKEVIISKSVVFKLCLQGNCNTCGYYRVSLERYLQLMVSEQIAHQDAVCSACFNNICHDNPDKVEIELCDYCNNICWTHRNQTADCATCTSECSDIINMDDNGIVDASDLISCIQEGGGSSSPIYAGPTCTTNGAGVEIGMFTDSSCTIQTNQLWDDISPGQTLSYSVLKSVTNPLTSLSCSPLGNNNQFRMLQQAPSNENNYNGSNGGSNGSGGSNSHADHENQNQDASQSAMEYTLTETCSDLVAASTEIFDDSSIEIDVKGNSVKYELCQAVSIGEEPQPEQQPEPENDGGLGCKFCDRKLQTTVSNPQKIVAVVRFCFNEDENKAGNCGDCDYYYIDAKEFLTRGLHYYQNNAMEQCRECDSVCGSTNGAQNNSHGVGHENQLFFLCDACNTDHCWLDDTQGIDCASCSDKCNEAYNNPDDYEYVSELFNCRPMAPNSDGTSRFIGPTCANDGNIVLGIFSDSECTRLVPSEQFDQYFVDIIPESSLALSKNMLEKILNTEQPIPCVTYDADNGIVFSGQSITCREILQQATLCASDGTATARQSGLVCDVSDSDANGGNSGGQDNQSDNQEENHHDDHGHHDDNGGSDSGGNGSTSENRNIGGNAVKFNGCSISYSDANSNTIQAQYVSFTLCQSNSCQGCDRYYTEMSAYLQQATSHQNAVAKQSCLICRNQCPLHGESFGDFVCDACRGICWPNNIYYNIDCSTCERECDTLDTNYLTVIDATDFISCTLIYDLDDEKLYAGPICVGGDSIQIGIFRDVNCLQYDKSLSIENFVAIDGQDDSSVSYNLLNSITNTQRSLSCELKPSTSSGSLCNQLEVSAQGKKCSDVVDDSAVATATTRQAPPVGTPNAAIINVCREPTKTDASIENEHEDSHQNSAEIGDDPISQPGVRVASTRSGARRVATAYPLFFLVVLLI